MKRKILVGVLAVALLLTPVLAVQAPRASAQSGGGYDLTWSTVDGGGATFSTGGTYELGGTMGQPDAGALSGGAYSLGGGFWGGVSSLLRVFLPLIQR